MAKPHPTLRARGQGRALPTLPGIQRLWRVRGRGFFLPSPALAGNACRWAFPCKIKKSEGSDFYG